MLKGWKRWVVRGAGYFVLMLIFNLALVASVLLIAVGLVVFAPAQKGARPKIEQGYVQADRRLGWRLKPNLEVFITDRQRARRELFFSTDAAGHRVAPENGNGERVLLLGDSYLQGFFLSDRETIANQLARRTGWQVLNTGVGGYSTDQQFLVMQDVLKRFMPRRTVVFFYINDLFHLGTDDGGFSKKKPFHPLVDGKPQLNRLQQVGSSLPEGPAARTEVCCIEGPGETIRRFKLKFLVLLYALPEPALFYETLAKFVRETKATEYVQARKKLYANPADPQFRLPAAFEYLSAMRGLIEAKGGNFHVFLIPEQVQMMGGRFEYTTNFQRQFGVFCREYRIDCLDPLEEFRAAHAKRDLYFMDDGHLSPAGAALAAEILARHVTGANR